MNQSIDGWMKPTVGLIVIGVVRCYLGGPYQYRHKCWKFIIIIDRVLVMKLWQQLAFHQMTRNDFYPLFVNLNRLKLIIGSPLCSQYIFSCCHFIYIIGDTIGFIFIGPWCCGSCCCCGDGSDRCASTGCFLGTIFSAYASGFSIFFITTGWNPMDTTSYGTTTASIMFCLINWFRTGT